MSNSGVPAPLTSDDSGGGYSGSDVDRDLGTGVINGLTFDGVGERIFGGDASSFAGKAGMWIGSIFGTGKFKLVKAVPDAAVVCRGGSCTAQAFATGKGVTTNPATGKLDGVSTGLGDSVASASKKISHGKVGVTTAGDIRAAGGQVVNDHGNHGTVSGLTAEKAAEVFNRIVKNPNR